MSQQRSSRSPALDITRCFAFLCVVTYHFYAYSFYYQKSIEGARMVLMTVIYFTSLLGVPLFLLLSGYLMGSKRPNKQYYRKLLPTLAVYFLASFLCYGYRYLSGAEPAVAGTVGDFLSMTLNYSTIPHAWYIAMYIGLFVVIPYLNILYDALETKQQRLGLVLAFLAISMLPDLTNILTVEAGHWRFQLHTYQYQTLLPTYWMPCYPMTYYLIGRHLREYPFSWGPRVRFLAAAGAVLGVAGINLALCYGTSLVAGPWCSYSSPITMVHAVLIFQFLSRLEGKELRPWMTRLLALLSRLCLGAYLVSWIFEDIFHKTLGAIQPDVNLLMNYFPIMVPAVYVCSLALSGAMELVITCCAKIFSKKA